MHEGESTRPIFGCDSIPSQLCPVYISHIWELCLEPLNVLRNEPLSSHILPDATRFIVALGPVWERLFFEAKTARMH